jgi:ketosteroid isomerase-like protein
MNAAGDFDAQVEAYHGALRAMVEGDPSGYKTLYSEADDVTLANPFGGVARGRAEVEERLERAAATFRDGEIVGFETIAKSGDIGACVSRGSGEVQDQGRRQQRANRD